MRKTTLLLFFALGQFISIAQINGNKNIISATFTLENLQILEVNLTADIIIDIKGKEEITITTDSNLMPYIGRTVKNGKMDLTQREWISPSQGHKIVIGAPALRKLISDAHSDIVVKNMSATDFKLIANVGTITMFGTIRNLTIENNVAKIDAGELIVENADVEITAWGEVRANVSNKLNTSVKDGSKLIIVNTPKELSGDAAQTIAQTRKKSERKKDVRYIDFKIKNNSWNRRHFVVVGPKPDGGKFSYGFPLNPGQVRTERWTTGTKIYKENSFGGRKLIVVIKAEDENQVVELFD